MTSEAQSVDSVSDPLADISLDDGPPDVPPPVVPTADEAPSEALPQQQQQQSPPPPDATEEKAPLFESMIEPPIDLSDLTPPSRPAPTATPPAPPPPTLGESSAAPAVPPAESRLPDPSALQASASADKEPDAEEPMHDVVLRPAQPGPSETHGGGGNSSGGGSSLDHHLRSAPRRGAGAASLASTVEVISAARSLDELETLLQSECVRAVSGAHYEAVARCVQYVRGLAREEERVLSGWPVLSINEWGQQQVRTLVLTSHALYRIAFAIDRGAIDHYSRTSLGACRTIERGRYAFKLLLTEPDGRENPFTYFWSAYVKKGSTDKRYEKVYYPIHPDSIPVELVLASIISSLQVANHLLCEQISSYCYVAKLEVRDYVPNPNAVDELMDKIVPSLQRMGDKVSEGIRAVLAPAASRRQRSSLT